MMSTLFATSSPTVLAAEPGTLLAIAIVVVFIVLVTKAINRDHRRLHPAMKAFGIMVGFLIVPIAIGVFRSAGRWEEHRAVTLTPPPIEQRQDRLTVELRPTSAIQKISGNDLALALRALVLDLSDNPALQLSSVQDMVVHRDGDANSIKLGDVARLRRQTVPGHGPHDVVVELAAAGETPALRDLVRATSQAIHKHLDFDFETAPFRIEEREDQYILRLPPVAALLRAEAGEEVIDLFTENKSPAQPAPPVAPEAPAPPEAPEAPAAPTPPAQPTAPVAAVAALAPPPAEAPPATTPRPAWIANPRPRTTGGFATVVSAGPFVTTDECQIHLDELMRQRVQEYLLDLLGPQASRLQISKAEIRSWISPDAVYLETTNHPDFGTMYSSYGRLEIDRRTQAELRERLRQVLVRDRLGLAGLGTGMVLLAIGTVFGFLKLDTATRGYYSGLLGLVAVAALATVVFAGLSLTYWTVR